jgi:MFS family permease
MSWRVLLNLAAAAECPKRYRWRVSPLFVLCTIQLILQLDFAVVNIALRTIQGELGFQPATLQWIITGYALTFGALLLLGGRLGDLFGRRRVLLIGLAVFGASSLACGIATGPVMLVLARLVQGGGAALLAPTVLATLASLYPDGARRSRALGAWTAATAVGGSSGLVIGGVLTQYLGWRSVFLVNIPLVLVLVPMVLRLLPRLPGSGTQSLDLLGTAMVTGSIAAFIFALSEGQERGFANWRAVLPFALAFFVAVAFVLIQRRSARPIIPPGFLAVPLRRISLTAMVLIGGIFASFPIFAAFILQQLLRFNDVWTGVAILPAPIALIVTASRLTPPLLARFGPKRVMLAGLLTTSAGQLWLGLVATGGGYAVHLVPGLVLTTTGAALVFPSVSVGVIRGVRADQEGLAGGLIPTAQQLGAALGVALLATLATAVSQRAGGTPGAGYDAAFTAAAVVVAGAAVVLAPIKLVARGSGGARSGGGAREQGGQKSASRSR